MPSPLELNVRADQKFILDTGAQPLVNDDSSLALAVNGEIYNHRILRKELKVDYTFKTHSDCEVIIPLVCGVDWTILFFGLWALHNGGY